MEKLCFFFVSFVGTINLVLSQTPPPPLDPTSPLSSLLQKNPTFQVFLSQNPAIQQLIQSNTELIKQLELNPSLINQTEKHANFLNSFLKENANLGQIIQDNPYVYAFILKQVDHAVETGQNSTIVIQMSEAEVQAQQKELEAQRNATNASTVETHHQKDALAGLSREQLIAMLTTMQAANQGSSTLNENVVLHQTSLPKQTPAKDSIPVVKPSLSGHNSQSSTSGVNPEQNFGLFNNSKPNGLSTVLVSDVNNLDTNDLIDLNNLADLTKLKMLYIAMYNREPASIQELQQFYTDVLAKLNIRTRKQVTDFLDKFKSTNTGTTSNGYIGHNTGGANTGSASNGYIGHFTGGANTGSASNGFIGHNTGGTNTGTASNGFIGHYIGGTNTGTASNGYIGHYTGGAHKGTASNGNIGQYTGGSKIVYPRLSCKEKMLQRKLAKYCGWNPSSPLCQQN